MLSINSLNEERTMNTIRTFLENMFSALPKTDAILKAKQDLYQMMIEKYDDYKRDGKTENEAVGLVISEFGNIDELLDELGITVEKINIKYIGKNDSEAVMNTYKKHSKRIAIGVFLILFGVSLAVIGEPIALFLGIVDYANLLRLIFIFIFMVPSIGLFIAAGLDFSIHNPLFEGEYELENEVSYQVDNDVKNYQRTYNMGIMTGVLIIITSAILFIGAAFIEEFDIYMVSIGVLVVAYGVYTLISKGVVMGGYSKLLKRGDYKPEMRKAEKANDLVAGIVFPLAAGIYLLISFLTGRWDITWIIWPVVGVIFAIFAGINEEIHKNKKAK
jgi:phosphate/sulfate permease